MRKPAAVTSLAMHVTALALLFLIRFHPSSRTPGPERTRTVTPLHAPRPRLKEGGGGQRERSPATLGRPPLAATRKIWIPPMLVRNENPRLVVEQALLETPEINLQSAVIGDPFGESG